MIQVLQCCYTTCNATQFFSLRCRLASRDGTRFVVCAAVFCPATIVNANVFRNPKRFWSEGVWKPSSCSLHDEVVIHRPKTLSFVHISGDSVARGMFKHFCQSQYANKAFTGESVKPSDIGPAGEHAEVQVCCSDAATFCMTYTVGWVTTKAFRPNYFKELFQSTKDFCKHSRANRTICLSSVPPELFSSHISNVRRWHWLFVGSHTDYLGPSREMCENLKISSSKSSVDGRVFVFGMTAIDPNKFNNKFRFQMVSRSNIRIEHFNRFIQTCLGLGNAVNMFHISHSLKESDYGDVVHFRNVSNMAKAIMAVFRTVIH